MSHAYAAVYFHCVFSTKDRRDSIPVELLPKLWAYVEGTAKNLGMVPVAVGGARNHMHLLLRLKPNMPAAEAIQKLKANSSRWMGEHGLAFEWQKGYAALSVSPSLVGAVKSYVLNQEEHHRKRDFEEERRISSSEGRHSAQRETGVRGVKDRAVPCGDSRLILSFPTTYVAG